MAGPGTFLPPQRRHFQAEVDSDAMSSISDSSYSTRASSASSRPPWAPDADFTARCDFSQHQNMDALQVPKVREDHHNDALRNPQKHRKWRCSSPQPLLLERACRSVSSAFSKSASPQARNAYSPASTKRRTTTSLRRSRQPVAGVCATPSHTLQHLSRLMIWSAGRQERKPPTPRVSSRRP